jgi:hypothetical protein
MFALPYLSGTDCIELLKRFGYRVRSRSGGLATLVLDTNVVIVPEASTLSPTLVRAILRTANIDPYDFVHEVSPASSQEVA